MYRPAKPKKGHVEREPEKVGVVLLLLENRESKQSMNEQSFPIFFCLVSLMSQNLWRGDALGKLIGGGGEEQGAAFHLCPSIRIHPYSLSTCSWNSKSQKYFGCPLQPQLWEVGRGCQEIYEHRKLLYTECGHWSRIKHHLPLENL